MRAKCALLASLQRILTQDEERKQSKLQRIADLLLLPAHCRLLVDASRCDPVRAAHIDEDLSTRKIWDNGLDAYYGIARQRDRRRREVHRNVEDLVGVVSAISEVRIAEDAVIDVDSKILEGEGFLTAYFEPHRSAGTEFRGKPDPLWEILWHFFIPPG